VKTEVKPRCPACGQVVTIVRLRKRAKYGDSKISEHTTRHGKPCHASGAAVGDGTRR